MNRKELVDELSQRFEGNRDVAAHALDSVVDVITKSISAGEKVVISGFGEFERRARDAGARAGEYVPEFKPGKELREVVSGTRQWRDRVTGPLAVVPASAVEAAEQASRTAAGTLRSVADKARELAGELASFGERRRATSSTARRGQAAKKAPAKKSTAKKAPAKKSTAKKAPAKKSTAKKSTAKKAPAKKSTAKKSTAKKAPAKKAPAAKKTAAEQSATAQSTAGEQQSGT